MADDEFEGVFTPLPKLSPMTAAKFHAARDPNAEANRLLVDAQAGLDRQNAQARAPDPAGEVARLRAENAELRSRLEALERKGRK